MPPFSLVNRTAVITGGSRGIGRAIAQAFANQGAKCVLLGRNQEQLTTTVRDLEQRSPLTPLNLRNGQPPQECADPPVSHSPGHGYFVCDITKQDAVFQTCKSIKQVHQKVDILVNAAGINVDSLLLRTIPAVTNEIIQTNLMGTIRTTQHMLKLMVRQSQGCIINISSIVGLQGNVGQSVYAATKAGIVGFTKALAKETGPRNIRVNCIAPGFIATDMTKDFTPQRRNDVITKIALGRLGTPEDVAQAAVYLAAAPYVTGQVLVVDGGTRL
ncbi:hypothetical protein IWQ61_004134 [Dispira simplex]|nr:hypothetical protein IWQ61_004134 [Dispira simplex]